jgi:pyridoxamine 5'-phosphate oxidase
MSDWNHKDLGGVRREYDHDQLDESGIPADPLMLLIDWMEKASRTNTPDPTAMTLSTVDESGSPSSRIVLLKRIHHNKLIFYTSYNSKKAREIKSNDRVAAHFYWPELERQVKISGTAEILEDATSDSYFSSRPFESKISSWASPQSEVVPDRDYLERAYQYYLKKFEASEEIPRPASWGGYAITPRRMEFWQGGRFRLHDRIEYILEGNRWSRVRLAP